MAQLKGIGTEDKRKVAAAAVLGVAVLALAFHTLLGGDSSAPAVPAAPARPAVTSAAPARTRGAAPSASVPLDPALHPELMAETENFLYTGSGRNIFSRESAPPPIERAIASARPSQQALPPQQAANAGPPPPPRVDLVFFGFAARRNGSRRVFLTHGEDVFVASEGDVVSHRYKVVSIAPSSVQVEDLLYSNTQTLPLVNN